jgi:hypothetical protein
LSLIDPRFKNNLQAENKAVDQSSFVQILQRLLYIVYIVAHFVLFVEYSSDAPDPIGSAQANNSSIIRRPLHIHFCRDIT